MIPHVALAAACFALGAAAASAALHRLMIGDLRREFRDELLALKSLVYQTKQRQEDQEDALGLALMSLEGEDGPAPGPKPPHVFFN